MGDFALNEVVRKFYDNIADKEWDRLVCDAYHRLEFIVTNHFLDKYLPKNGLILDAGGGPGRYTIELAKKGYEVVLLDLSSECLKKAVREIDKAGIKGKVIKIVEGSITDLSEFPTENFDAVLCLGTLSHLIEKRERNMAASELVRVAKKTAFIFTSVISLYGVFRTILQSLPNSSITPSRKLIFSQGIHKASESFTNAYFFHPTELRELFENYGVETLEMATCEGLSSHLKEETNRIYEDKKKWNFWLKILLRTCDDPNILGLGEHFLYVGRKI